MNKKPPQYFPGFPANVDPAMKKTIQHLYDRVNYLVELTQNAPTVAQIQQIQQDTSALKVALSATQDTLTKGSAFVGFGQNQPVSATPQVASPITDSGGVIGFDQTVNLDNNARVTVRKNSGSNVGTRRRLNFIEGSGVTITEVDSSLNEEVAVTISAGGASGNDLIAPPASGTFTWRNQSGATVTDSTNIFVGAKKVPGWRMDVPNTNVGLHILEINTPATPYTVTAAFVVNFIAENYHEAGLAWIESGSGKLAVFEIYNASGFVHMRDAAWNGVNSFGGGFSVDYNYNVPQGALLWRRIADDGSTRTVSYSMDGDGWIVFNTETHTTWITPDKLGVCLSSSPSGNVYPNSLSLVYWNIT